MKSECILHPGALTPKGYGQRWFEGTNRRAHRVAYAIANGLTMRDLVGKLVRHRCDNPTCVNPAHLELGTPADNVRDRDERGRTARGERGGTAKLTAAQVSEIRSRYVKFSTISGAPALAREFGVNQATINSIVTNQTWKD